MTSSSRREHMIDPITETSTDGSVSPNKRTYTKGTSKHRKEECRQLKYMNLIMKHSELKTSAQA